MYFFFPSKNLGCYGDGGALYTNNRGLAFIIKKIANHGQERKYHHEVIGVNSRLDTIQAAILSVKLKFLDEYASARRQVAATYNITLNDLKWLKVPKLQMNSTHVYHQYTLKLEKGINRDLFIRHLSQNGIPAMIYYPIPLHLQKAFQTQENKEGDFPISELLCQSVISLPIHTEMNSHECEYIVSVIRMFNN